MKNLYFLLLLISMYAFSFETPQSFILTNTGQKINIKPNFFRIDSTERIIFYKLFNSETEIKMSFKELNYILIGKNKFQTYKLNNSNEINGYFVLSENTTYSLILSSNSDDEDNNLMRYYLYIVDKSNKIIDNLNFDNRKSPKSSNVRADIFTKVQFYFGNCSLLINRLTSFDNMAVENLNLDILKFFDSPIFSECL
jgi:hypothetical protein